MPNTSESTVTRFANRMRPAEHLHLEGGRLAVGPVEPGWLSAQWVVEPVEPVASTWFRFRSLWKPEHCLHIESGVPEAGPIEPGWLSAQWRFELVADAAFVRVVNRLPLVQYIHVESGKLDLGPVGPGWLSAQWVLEKVSGTDFVRLRNRWKPTDALNIESGALVAGPVESGWLSAQWSLQKVDGGDHVRLSNRWKPGHFIHIEGGKAEAGEIAPGWLSAQWVLEKVAGTSFVRLRNRWEAQPVLHVERGILEVSATEPGWSAHWLPGNFRRRVIPMSLFQRTFDDYLNNRENPLFRLRIDDNKFTVLVENPLTQTLEQHGESHDLGKLEVPKLGNDIRIVGLDTERVTVNMTSDPTDGTPEVQVRVRFETKGTEIEVNDGPNVDLTGARIDVRLRLGFDAASGTIDVASFVPLVDSALDRAKFTDTTGQVMFRGRTVRVDTMDLGAAFVRAKLREKLLSEFIATDVSVDVSGLPDGKVASAIESMLNSKILGALLDQFRDGTGQGWTQWSSVSEGASTPGAPMSLVVTGTGRLAMFLADPAGGVYTASRSKAGAWGPWATVSEGSTTPGGHVTAIAIGGSRVAVFLADPAGGVFTASGNAEQGWSPWTSVSSGVTRPGAPVSAVLTGEDRVAVFLADPGGAVFSTLRRGSGEWAPWSVIPGRLTTPGGHVTAVLTGVGTVALFIADASGEVFMTSGTPGQAWAPWRSVSQGSTLPGARIGAVWTDTDRISLFLSDPAGGVYTASGSSTGPWSPWSPVSEGLTTPGGCVTAVALDGAIALFLVDPAGGVYTAARGPTAGWGPWKLVSEGRTVPGAAVAAAVVPEVERSSQRNRISLALADPNGGVYASKDGAVFRPGFNRRLTRALVGGEHRLIASRSDGATLTLDYLVGEPLPLLPQTQRDDLAPGTLANIDHIVVVMMENRSFDHMLGYLGHQRPDVEGLQEADLNQPTKTNTFEGKVHRPFLLPDTRFEVSPCHNYDCVAVQIDGVDGSAPMGGFVAEFAARAAKTQAEYGVDIEAGDIMGFHDGAQVPVYDALAREFLVCDHWFCSHPGGTFPNRFYATTGRLNRDAGGQPELHNTDPLQPSVSTSIFDHLSDRGVSWRYFEHGYGFLRLFDRYRFDDTNVIGIDDPERGFFASARAGTLPSVTYIDPDFIEVPPGNDDHAPADVGAGQQLIGRIVNALMAGPQWRKTLLVVTYDEHGGFYDHVEPPAAAPVSGVGRYGVRVPALVVSPWVNRGAVAKDVFDHTSILKTICRRFLSANPPDMGERVAQAGDLSQVLRASPREDSPHIPQPGAVAPRRLEWSRWSEVAEGVSTPGAAPAAVPTGAGGVALWLTNPAGAVYVASRDAGGAWGAWSSVSEGRTVPGGRITAVPTGAGDVALFLSDAGGEVFTASGTPDGGWSPWSTVSQGSTPPGAPISAVVTARGRITLFLADPAGSVYTASRDAAGAWGQWTSVSQGRTAPGGHVTAVATGSGDIALFLADPGGEVFTASGTPERGWSPWSTVSQGNTLPGGPISAVVTAPGRIALFLSDPAGGVYTASRDAAGAWSPWSSVSEGRTVPGGLVTAVPIGDGDIALFLADAAGGIYSATGRPAHGWSGWSPVARGRTTAGGHVSVVVVPAIERPLSSVPYVSRDDRVALTICDEQGHVRATHTLERLARQDDKDFHGLLRMARYPFFVG